LLGQDKLSCLCRAAVRSSILATALTGAGRARVLRRVGGRRRSRGYEAGFRAVGAGGPGGGRRPDKKARAALQEVSADKSRPTSRRWFVQKSYKHHFSTDTISLAGTVVLAASDWLKSPLGATRQDGRRLPGDQGDSFFAFV